MKKTNWEKIKAEYITDSTTSYRKLAAKYKVSFATLKQRAAKGEWVKAREQLKHKLDTEIEKTVIENNVDYYKHIHKKVKIATEIILQRNIEFAKSIEAWDPDRELKLNRCQKTVESVVDTLDKICYPKHEQTDNNITVVLGSAEEYAE